MGRKAELEAQLSGNQSHRSSTRLDNTDNPGQSQRAGGNNSPSALLDGDGETGYDMDEENMDDRDERSESVDSISPVNMQGLEPSNALAAFRTHESQSTNFIKPSSPQQPVQAGPTTIPPPVLTTHPEIMQKMFPHGMTEGQRRMDFSGQLFRTSTPSETVREKPVARMTQRADMNVGAADATALIAQEVERLTKNDGDKRTQDVAEAENVIAVDDDDGEPAGDIPP